MERKQELFKRKLLLGSIDYDNKGKDNHPFELEFRLGRNFKGKTIDLEPIDKYYTLAITGDVWMPSRGDIVSGGQIISMTREFFPDKPEVIRICDLWERLHLNDMKAGSRPQEEAIEEWKKAGNRYEYNAVCQMLKDKGIYEDRGYEYGTAWLVEIIPDEVIKEVFKLFKCGEYYDTGGEWQKSTSSG